MKTEARLRLEAACAAVGLAQLALLEQKNTIRAFIKESREMETFGPIVDPTLYRDPERRAVDKVLLPIFEAAIHFAETYEKHLGNVKDALAKADARP